MIKDILQTFLPWILYVALAGHNSSQMKLAICAAAIAALVFERKGLKKKFILSWVTLIFFVFMLMAVVLCESKFILQHAWVLSNGALALIAWGSVLIKQPFTLQYARERVTSDKWHHPVFWKINYILTMVWGGIFVLCMLTNIARLYYPINNEWVYEVITDGATIFAIWFSVYFPTWYAERKKAE